MRSDFASVQMEWRVWGVTRVNVERVGREELVIDGASGYILKLISTVSN